MRRYIWLSLISLAVVVAAWQTLHWAVDRTVHRLRGITPGVLILDGRRVGLSSAWLMRGSVALHAERLMLDLTDLDDPTVHVARIEVAGPRVARMEDVSARLQGGMVAMHARGTLERRQAALVGELNLLSRTLSLGADDGPLFIGETRGWLTRVDRVQWSPAGLRATGVDAVGPRGRLADASIDLARAPCGWRPRVRDGHAWLVTPSGGRSETTSAPAAPPTGCPIEVEHLEIVADTPIGLRSASIEEAHLFDGVVSARGRTAGAEGTLIAPLDGSWAVAEGALDLQTLAVALGEERLTGHVRGRVDVLRRDGRLHLGATGTAHVVLAHPAVAAEPVEVQGLEFDVVLDHADEASRLTAHTISLGAVTASAEIDLRTDVLLARARMKAVHCQALWDAIPAALRGPYADARLSGTVAPAVGLHLPRADAFKLRLDWDGPSDCVVDALNTALDARPTAKNAGSTADVDWLLRDFRLPVRYATRPIEVGPGTTAYVPIAQLPRWVGAAAIVSEDNAFDRGQALNLSLLRRALMFNLDRGRYVYGGSTIPQQLVKNLFLTRRKTLARKLQEALVAMRVVEAVPKSRILELYLNCIEFAPNVYGIERAARYYFQKSARHLTPKEAAFLATAKPSPKYANLMRHQGATPDTPHFKEYMRRIIARMQRRGAITAAQAAAARPFRLFWRNGRAISASDSPRADAHL